MNQINTSAFKDPTNLTRWTRRFLFLYIALAGFAVISSGLEFKLLLDLEQGNFLTEAEAQAAAESNDLRQGLIGLAQILLYIITAVFVLKWIYRAAFNASQLTTSKMQHSPGWCVGWYFVPFANLWKPYNAMKEIWQVSQDPESWDNSPVSPLVSVWWVLWLISNFVGQIIFRLSMQAEDIETFKIASSATIVSDLLDIPLTLVLLAIINRIHEMQMWQSGLDSGDNW